MKKMTRFEAFAKIFDLAKLPSDAVAAEDKLQADVVGIFFETDDLVDLQDAVTLLHNAEKDLHESFGWEGFKSAVLREVKALKIEGRGPSNEDVSAFFKTMLGIPRVDFNIFREISGVAIETPTPLDLGPFRIYRRDLHQKELSADSHVKEGLFIDTGDHLIRVVASARDSNFAMELAEEQFLRFDHIIAFICGQQNQSHRVSASRPGGPARVKSYMATEAAAFHVIKRASKGGTIRLDAEDISNLDENGKIWAILSSVSPTKMQRRILLAIEWIGQARLEMSRANAMLKAAIATEILFNLRREPIGPSISSQIAETMAHVVGGHIQVKLMIEKEMKRLYGLRSDVTHRGAVNFEDGDIRLLMALASDAIMILLTQAPYKDFANEDQFVEHLSVVKYSAPPPAKGVSTMEG
ncbi:HEPN domain-containing protein [Janthinobacterium sp. YR213]|uniref:HEPN domain-containing protein n=1 Tax=Janthinobacterium sp. YR213 TaxID=1881027 RepID=UPI0011142D21